MRSAEYLAEGHGSAPLDARHPSRNTSRATYSRGEESHATCARNLACLPAATAAVAEKPQSARRRARFRGEEAAAQMGSDGARNLQDRRRHADGRTAAAQCAEARQLSRRQFKPAGWAPTTSMSSLMSRSTDPYRRPDRALALGAPDQEAAADPGPYGRRRGACARLDARSVHVEEDGYFYGRGTLDEKRPRPRDLASLKLAPKGSSRTATSSSCSPATRRPRARARSSPRPMARLDRRRFRAQRRCRRWRLTPPTAGRSGFGLQTAEKSSRAFTSPRPIPAATALGRDPTMRSTSSPTRSRGWSIYRFTPMLNETTREYFHRPRQAGGRQPARQRDRAWLANPNDGAAADFIEASPLEVGLTRTRCVATMLKGGHADNALPQLAEATVNCRIMPGRAAEAS